MRKRVLGLLLVILLLVGCSKKNDVFLESNEFEVYSNLKIGDIVKSKDDIKIVNEEDTIDTSKVGKKEIIIKYSNNGKEKYDSFEIEIVDKTAPNIEGEDIIEIYVGSNVDLIKNAKVTDNYSKDIDITVEGEYDIETVGKYPLKFVAKDEFGNKTEKEFLLNIKNAKVKTTGYYVYKTKETWHEIKFSANGKFIYLPWFCPGSGCGGYSEEGTYIISGNKITVTLTQSTNDLGEVSKFKKPEKWELIINTDNQLEMKGNKYKWQKNFTD